jgi:hypothetical protein
VLEVPQKKNGRDIGHAHRHAGMAGIRFLDAVHGEAPDRVGCQGEIFL